MQQVPQAGHYLAMVLRGGLLCSSHSSTTEAADRDKEDFAIAKRTCRYQSWLLLVVLLHYRWAGTVLTPQQWRQQRVIQHTSDSDLQSWNNCMNARPDRIL